MSEHERLIVAVIEGNRLFRDSIMAVLKREKDIKAVGVGSAVAVSTFAKQPDIVLMQCLSEHMRQLREIVHRFSKIKIIATNADEAEMDLVQLIQLGVSGFLTRDANHTDMVHVIRSVAQGTRVIPETIAAAVCRQLYQKIDNGGISSLCRDSDVTSRELQVLHLIVKGLTNKEIASKLNIAEPTVKSHVHNILQKLSVRRRVDLIHCCWNGFADQDRTDLVQNAENVVGLP